MNKGFSIFEERIRDRDVAFSDGLGELGEILLTEIGGSMGPIYGTIFCGMAERCEGAEKIDLTLYAEMLRRGLEDLSEIIAASTELLINNISPQGKRGAILRRRQYDVYKTERKACLISRLEAPTERRMPISFFLSRTEM